MLVTLKPYQYMTKTLVSLAEAATFLGISKPTLRNWDRQGKLTAIRNPSSGYRCYDLEELRGLKPSDANIAQVCKMDSVSDMRTVKRIVARLSAALRDVDGDSSLIERFDELSKILFLKLHICAAFEFSREPNESAQLYVSRLKQAYRHFSENNPNIVPERFGTLNASEPALLQCASILDGLSFLEADFDIKGIAYEEVIRNTFDKSHHQQFFTPHSIVEFIVTMMQPYLSGIVADPACGTAGFLAEVVRAGSVIERLVGLEIDERLAWTAGVNLVLHGADEFKIECLPNGGTLGHSAFKYRGAFDAIITNPPFGSDFSDTGGLSDYVLGVGKTSRRRGILFIERCWELLKEEGVIGIVIDDGVLNLPSALDVREFILARFNILALVSLPETAFMPYATVNSSILFMQKTSRANKNTSVFFGKAEDIGRKNNGDDDILYDVDGTARLNTDLPKILDSWHRHLEGSPVNDSETSFVTNVEENLRGDESLRIDFRYHHPSRYHSRDLLATSKFPLARLSEICDERNETSVPSTEMADQVILYTGLANIEAGSGVAYQTLAPAASLKSAVKRYERGDILFARMRPNLRKVALVTFEDGGFASPECTVLTVKRGRDGAPIIDPVILVALLRSDLVFGQILHLVAGIGRPRLSVTDLRRVTIPLPPLAVQAEAKAHFEKKLTEAKELLLRAKSLQEQAHGIEANAVSALAEELIIGGD